MSETRLDPATLRWGGRWHEEHRLAASKHAAMALEPALSRAQASVHERSRNRFAELATEAEALPPRLSDWIRACEGTGLGEPTEGIVDGNLALFFGDTLCVELHRVDLPGARLHATIHNTPTGPGWLDVSTPAELRAALERLAEAKGG